ncbi:hypothetical protein QTL95_17615 [Rhizobium sp. S152]|uniref:hypothetical protein n=1 Tax=Rhizobium sp. S152 TaxID=3055038 RepID=UPI0025A9C30A|nr:hypothetical protein [Rhizobium sp. S152]MDM9627719.1 hypothetical protein [Rhizobium sp. S152]
MSDTETPPTVTFNRINKKAFFIFRLQRYELPGMYKSLAEAQYVAERQCRSMGWEERTPK